MISTIMKYKMLSNIQGIDTESETLIKKISKKLKSVFCRKYKQKNL